MTLRKTAAKQKAAKKPAASADVRENGNGRSWLNLRTMEIFVAVVQQDGMTNAAHHLGMTQSAVSQAIGAIEAGLGAQLVDRSTRPLQLTLFGTTFYERAQELLRRARELEQLVQMQQNSRLPLLRIGMVDSFASTVGPHLLREISSLASRWAVVSGVRETNLRALQEQRVDLVISSEEMGRNADIVTLPLLREPLIIVAPRSFKNAGASQADVFRELAAGLPLVRYSPGAFIGRQVESYLQHHRFDIARQYEFDTSDAVLAMVRAGMGWTITTPLCVLKTQAVAADFRFLPLEPTAPPRSVNLVAFKGEHSALWQRIAASARTILKLQWVPALRKLAPWADIAEVE